MPGLAYPRTLRRWLRFSVRGLIIFVLLVAGWMGWVANSARIQRDAVATIRRASGGVVYDWSYSGGEFEANKAPEWPRWLVDTLGEDYFGHAAKVILFGRMTPDDALSARDKRQITAALAQLGHLDRLVELYVEGTEADDDALVGLKQLTGLRRLSLNGSKITDPSLLEKLTQLEHLGLLGTPVSDTFLAQLKGLTRLKTLDLGGTHITDAGLLHLESFSSLEELNLNETRVTDAGLAYLRRLPSLNGLGLAGTRVSDIGLMHLKALPGLQGLNVSNTLVTEAGVHQLQLMLPKILIDH